MRCGGSVGADQLDESCENSLRREDRRRGGGGWKGCEEADGEGEGGREQYRFSEAMMDPRCDDSVVLGYAYT